MHAQKLETPTLLSHPTPHTHTGIHAHKLETPILPPPPPPHRHTCTETRDPPLSHPTPHHPGVHVQKLETPPPHTHPTPHHPGIHVQRLETPHPSFTPNPPPPRRACTETKTRYATHLFLVLLQDGLQVELLLVVEVEVLALGLRLGAHSVGNGRPVATMLQQSWPRRT